MNTGDSDPQDYARIWMENLQSYTGTELQAANSAQERWAQAIANLGSPRIRPKPCAR